MNSYKVRTYFVLFLIVLILFGTMSCALAKKANAAEAEIVSLQEQSERNPLFESAEDERRFYSQSTYTKKSPAVTTATTKEAEEKTVEVIATAYCACEVCCGEWALNRPLDENGEEIIYTASGARAYANHTIAVDPDVFPFGTVLVIDGVEYVAEDSGSAIVGKKIDIYFDDHETAWNFGLQHLEAVVKE